MDSEKSDAVADGLVRTSPACDSLATESPSPAHSSAAGGQGVERDEGEGARMMRMMVPHPSSVPLTRTRSYNILGSIPTDVFLQLFKDRIVYCVSQVDGGRVGHWFLCECQPDLVRPRGTDMVTTTLLGAQRDGPDATEGMVYARQLCQELALLATSSSSSTTSTSEPDSRRGAAVPMAYPTVLLGISLHPTAKGRPEAFKALIQALVTFYQESLAEC